MIKAEPLTAEMLRQIDGKIPDCSVRGYALTDNGNVICAACVMTVDGQQFLSFTGENLMEYRRYMISGWKLIKPLLRPGAMAVQAKSYPTSAGLLKHFGFEPFDGDLWIWRG